MERGDRQDPTANEALNATYTRPFERNPTVTATIANRIVQGRHVIDHEKVSGFGGSDGSAAVAIYEVRGDKIVNVWCLE